jgi:hypothetical protein
MRRTLQYVAMTRDERNVADVVPAQAGISVFQQPVRSQDDPLMLLKPEEYDIFINMELMNFDKSG